MKFLYPACIIFVILSPGDIFDMSRIDQVYFKTFFDEDCKEWLPVNAGALHGNSLDFTLF